MTAYKGKAVFPGHREAALADLLLNAAQVQNQSTGIHKAAVVLQPFGAAAGIDCKQQQLTRRDGFLIQPSVDRTGEHGKGQGAFVQVGSIDRVTCHGISPGHGAANQT